MKANLIRVAVAVAVGLVAICASASSALAQSAFNGRFTLPEAARWQSASLPAGDYTFVLKSSVVPAQVTVTSADGRSAIVTTIVSDKRTSDGQSYLLIERRGGTQCIREMHLADLGITFSYGAPKIPKDEQKLAQAPAISERVLIAANN
jgi:hypothetical protein